MVQESWCEEPVWSVREISRCKKQSREAKTRDAKDWGSVDRDEKNTPKFDCLVIRDPCGAWCRQARGGF